MVVAARVGAGLMVVCSAAGVGVRRRPAGNADVRTDDAAPGFLKAKTERIQRQTS